jgi:hypothetical protein
MKFFIVLFAAMTCVSTLAFCQETQKTVHLNLTNDELNIVGQALDLMPYGKVMPVIKDFHDQISAQFSPVPQKTPETAAQPEVKKP